MLSVCGVFLSTLNFLKEGSLPVENLTKEYLVLFNAIIDTQNSLEELRSKLISALNKAEELYISQGE